MKLKHLTSGQMEFSDSDEVFQTVLGSCVSLCIYDRVKKMGGMIHYLLPSANLAPAQAKIATNPLNFADQAIPLLLKEFKKRNSNPAHLEVNICGGGQQVIDELPMFSSLPQIGSENIAAALNILKNFRLKIAKQKVGHRSGAMLVRFNPFSGEVKFAMRNLAAREEAEAQKNYKYRVLIVDDSAPIRKIIRKCLESANNIEVVGEASDALEAEKLRMLLKPDVMTLDIQMPHKDGVTYLREVMRLTPMPVIMVSDMSLKEMSPVMEALELGAFDYLQKPSLSDFTKFSLELEEKIKLAGNYGKRIYAQIQSKQNPTQKISSSEPLRDVELIAIGASTGGIEALRQVFLQFPADTPPIVVVQHIPPEFSRAFANRLNQICQIAVAEAIDGDVLKKGHAYIAPGGKQMKIEKWGGQVRIRITDDNPVNRFKPSVDYMFDSISKLDNIKKMRIGILTGMGDDGARGMLKLKGLGASTFAQNEETCVVYGMPKIAIEMGAANKALPIEQIAAALLGMTHK